MSRFSFLLFVFLLSGCQTYGAGDAPLRSSGFSIGDVVKGDVDQVAEITVRQSKQYLRLLAEKLYRRNPDQLRRGGYAAGPEEVAAWLVEQRRPSMHVQWGNKRAGDLIRLGFSPDFEGDRVATLIFGLRSMMEDAYGSDGEFYLNHQYDPQKIYYLARNIEIAAWRLKSVREPSGRPLLLSVGEDDEGVLNTSYERLAGKLVALHDHFAQVIADTNNRVIKNVIQGVASAAFFPI